MAEETPQQPLFTCLSCSIAFLSAEDQRIHYRSDHHRYNMKRRVASLPPVSVATFNEKVIQRRTETAIMSSPKGSSCETCGKTYTTEGAYRSHINSKKHKENEVKAASRPKVDLVDPTDPETQGQPNGETVAPAAASSPPASPKPSPPFSSSKDVSTLVDADASDDEITQT
ncbi:hypothetical protein SERLADRAFT_466249, partial [Serpula lacrymans var. lacrymans S7.9]